MTLFFIGTTNPSTLKLLALADFSLSGAKHAVSMKGTANLKPGGSGGTEEFCVFPLILLASGIQW
jgi:hypothetical protein